MTQLDPKYVASNRPINSRTEAKHTSLFPVVNPIMQERLTAMKARNRFGVRLTEQLRKSGSAGNLKGLSAQMVAAGIVTTVSMIALLLAAIQVSGAMTIAGALGLSAGLSLLLHAHRKSARALSEKIIALPLFDEENLENFDNALSQFSTAASEEVVVQLRELKQQIFRIAKLTENQSIDENFTQEDKHYLTESLRRYLPDSLQSYLLVPEQLRASQMITENQTAEGLLLSQIALLQAGFAKQETKLCKGAAEQLLRQQRFLEAKNKI